MSCTFTSNVKPFLCPGKKRKPLPEAHPVLTHNKTVIFFPGIKKYIEYMMFFIQFYNSLHNIFCPLFTFISEKILKL